MYKFQRLISVICFLFSTVSLLGCASPAREDEPKSLVEEEISGGNDFAFYEKRIKKAIEEGMIYECVLHIGQDNEVLFEKVYGVHIKKGGVKVPPSSDAIYDLASVTKPVAMATSILILYDTGKIRMEDKIVNFLPELKDTNKENITVFQLLTHTSGFKYDHTSKRTHDTYLRYIKDKPLDPQKSNKMLYSAINYTLLQIILERLTGEGLDSFAKRHIFDPLKMKDTMYNPSNELIDRIAPNKDNNGMLTWGKAAAGMALNSVDGSRGLFSTVSDMAKYCNMIINQAEWSGIRILQKETCKRMISEKLGWWYFAKNDQSVFHPGGTGTMMYINVHTKKYLIFLSNGMHSYFKNLAKFSAFVEGFAEFADGRELGTVKKLGLISR